MARRVSFNSGLTFALLCFSHFYAVTSNPAGDSLDKINPDENKQSIKINACPTLTFLGNWPYVVKCSTITVPTKFTKDVDVAMCMAVYDITSRICLYESQHSVISENKMNLPKSPEEFESDMKKLQISEPDFVGKLCKNISTIFDKVNDLNIQPDPKTVPYSKYVNENLLSQEECKYTCHKPKNAVNPFCMILLWANNLFSTVKPLKILDNTKNVQNAATIKEQVPVANILPPEEKSPVDNKVAQVEDKETKPIKKVEKIAEAAKSPANVPPKQTVEQYVPPNDSKTSEIKPKPQENPSVNVESEAKQPKIGKAEEQGKDEPVLSVQTSKEKVNDAVPKQIENPHENSFVQPEDENGENEFNSDEEHQNKKPNEEDGQEANEPGNDKESNADDQHETQDVKKSYRQSPTENVEDESHFFMYFSIISLLCIGLYVGYHNKQKILAMVLEGRRSRRSRGSRRRPSTASYRKLDCNLEEAVTSQCNSNVTHVIY